MSEIHQNELGIVHMYGRLWMSCFGRSLQIMIRMLLEEVIHALVQEGQLRNSTRKWRPVWIRKHVGILVWAGIQ